MLTTDTIRQQKDEIIETAKNRGLSIDIEKIISLDNTRKETIVKIQKLREERNAISKTKPGEGFITRGKSIKEELKTLAQSLEEVEKQLKEVLMVIPNIPLPHVPRGDASKNETIREVGTPPPFSFTPKDHLELGEQLDIIDIPRATKVSGSRFAYLKNEGALLELALVQFALQTLIKEGFSPIIPPALIKKDITEQLGYWHGGNHNNYYLVSDYEEVEQGKEVENPLYLVGTGEHAVVPMYQNEILEAKNLPLKFAAFSPCFRREAGTYGKDTRGILRVHQFDKVEMVCFVKPEDDEKMRAHMLSTVENMLQQLKLPYRVVALADGDSSLPAAETIDVETWIPSQNQYRETHSISTTTTFQSNRLRIRYKENSNDQAKSVHILNGTAFAIGRMIIAILENFQQEDGSIQIPEVLQKYIGFDVIRK